MSCGAPPEEGDNSGNGPDIPCSCTLGAKRCSGAQIQVCEASTAECSSWGPGVSCPGGACANGACPGSCSDTCAGGTSRCASDSAVEICRIGNSGCLEWVAQACPAAQYCGSAFCQAAIPCDPACPGDYKCRPTGVCGGGNPAGLVLNVKTVQLSGKVTLNGAAPKLDPMCTTNPTGVTAHVRLTEVTKGYSFTFNTLCKDGGFGFTGVVYPGTYKALVDGNGTLSDVPVTAYVANNALAVAADTAGVVLDVKTVQLSGKVTLNGAAPKLDAMCPTNPTSVTAHVRLIDPNKGYSYSFNTLCKDSTFAFSGVIYPGTYAAYVDGNGTLSDIPVATYVTSNALMVAADTAGVVLDVKTVQLSGKVTLNGAAPKLDPMCATNPTSVTAHVKLTETTKGYSYSFNTLCKDGGFGFTGVIYPGTYKALVDGNGTLSDVPVGTFVANSALVVAADTAGVVLDVKTVQLSGKVTLNGAAPKLDAMCPTNPTSVTAHVRLTDPNKGYSYSFNTLCKDSTFAFSGVIYPGTYAAYVDGNGTLSDIPVATYVASNALMVAADTAGVVIDVKTVQMSGKVTLNGAAPKLDPMCATNPTSVTSHVKLIETTKGYTYSFNTLCKDSGFGFTGVIYPGVYAAYVDGNGTLSDIPVQTYAASGSLALVTDTSAVVLDVKTVRISGKVTLNGMAPKLDAMCTTNPTAVTAHVRLTETNRGYSFAFNTLCSDSSFGFTGVIYPGTYAAFVDGNGTLSDVPVGTFLTISAIALP